MKETTTVIENFDIATIIPVGRANAVSRKYLTSKTGLSDRAVRKEIELSTAPIINMGYGYFIPDENDAYDMSEKEAYCLQERQRIQTLVDKMNAKFPNITNHMAENVEMGRE